MRELEFSARPGCTSRMSDASVIFLYDLTSMNGIVVGCFEEILKLKGCNLDVYYTLNREII